MRAVRWMRLALGLLNLGALVALLAGLCPSASVRLSVLARLQFAPALLAFDFVVVAALLALAFFRGRVYCETLCPLGVAQDVLRLARLNPTRRVCSRLPVGRRQRAVRWMVAALFVVSAVLALLGVCMPVVQLLDPYAVFARSVAWFATPNPSVALAVFSFAVFAAVAALALVGKGRIWCNWICPVGTVFAAVARFSPRQDAYCAGDGCGRCRACIDHMVASKDEVRK